MSALVRSMPTATIEPIASPPRLDTDETYPREWINGVSECDPGLPGSYHAFRHSSWMPIRRKTWRALKDAWTQRPQMAVFEGCGQSATLHRSIEDPNKYQLRSKKCKSRWCIPCSRERGRSIAATLADIVGIRQVRFITLTLRTTSEPLHESIRLLTKGFARLRNSSLWRKTQDGGAAFLEVKFNPDKERWHPHLHIVSEGRFINKQALSDAWTRASHGSFIVDVKLVHGRRELCSYITKYVTKSVSNSVYRDHDRFVEAIKAMRGRRTCTTYGTWRGQVLVAKPDADAWLYVCTYAQALRSARANPYSDRALALRALTSPRKQDEWKQDARPPPNGHQTTLDYDYAAVSYP